MRDRNLGNITVGAVLVAASALLALGTLPSSAAQALPIPLIPCGATDQLAQAIRTLNTAGLPGQIYLTVNCTYDLPAAPGPDAQTGLPDIRGNVTIVGSGDTIERSSAARFRLFRVAPGGALSLSGVTLSNGLIRGAPGGGVLDEGTLTLTNITLDGNTAPTGGGIFVAARATATITGSVIEHNTATMTGGGISSDGATHVSNSVVNDNTAIEQGGGLASNENAAVALTDVTITDNVADSGGGGVANLGGSLAITGGEISGNNTASGPAGIIQTSGSISIKGTVISDNAPTDCIGGPTVIPDCTT